MKKCSKCSRNKDTSEFGRYERCKDGLRYECNNCRKIYRLNNKDLLKVSRKQDHLKHREERIKKMKEYNRRVKNERM